MRFYFFLFILFLSASTSNSQDIAVFKSGTEGHLFFRIPAIIGLPNGHLLAFAEGRVADGGDFGDINIVLKKSTDNGTTWSSLQVVVDYEKLQAGNPAPVVDLLDPRYPQGRIFLFYNTGNHHEYNVRQKEGYREVWYVTSIDGGVSWSTPKNITAQTHKILQPQVDSTYNHPEDWRTYANTPGHALQFSKGPYKGRIYIPANHSEGNAKSDDTDYVAHGYYTDDHGDTFKISDNVPFWGSNESTAAMLSNGRLMLNSRNQKKKDVRARVVSISNDGGKTWERSFTDTNLPDPENQASLLNLGTKKKKEWLAFSNAADVKDRNNLTVRISKDEGKTWFKNILIASAPKDYKGAYTAYSDIVKLNKNKIGVLYEKNHYSEIVFRVVDWKKEK